MKEEVVTFKALVAEELTEMTKITKEEARTFFLSKQVMLEAEQNQQPQQEQAENEQEAEEKKGGDEEFNQIFAHSTDHQPGVKSRIKTAKFSDDFSSEEEEVKKASSSKKPQIRSKKPYQKKVQQIKTTKSSNASSAKASHSGGMKNEEMMDSDIDESPQPQYQVM